MEISDRFKNENEADLSLGAKKPTTLAVGSRSIICNYFVVFRFMNYFTISSNSTSNNNVVSGPIFAPLPRLP